MLEDGVHRIAYAINSKETPNTAPVASSSGGGSGGGGGGDVRRRTASVPAAPAPRGRQFDPIGLVEPPGAGGEGDGSTRYFAKAMLEGGAPHEEVRRVPETNAQSVPETNAQSVPETNAQSVPHQCPNQCPINARRVPDAHRAAECSRCSRCPLIHSWR